MKNTSFGAIVILQNVADPLPLQIPQGLFITDASGRKIMKAASFTRSLPPPTQSSRALYHPLYSPDLGVITV